ncbi:hypothetical protein WJX72_009580 [[Myrmecia] bisecta]|uniref:Uncharacterized protein n=1 Tax=[Myrmecia] bisecta TaxID=41462 RepID=A0AAW1Q237_9CHLO
MFTGWLLWSGFRDAPTECGNGIWRQRCWITPIGTCSLRRALPLAPVVLYNLTTDCGLEGGPLNPANLLFSQGVPQSCTCPPGPDDILFKATPLVQLTPSWHLQHANNVLPAQCGHSLTAQPSTGAAGSGCGAALGGGPARGRDMGAGSFTIQVVMAMF